SDHHHIASFVGFFPASNPQVDITVIVDDADAFAPGGTAYGALVAAPVFKRLGEQLIQYLDIQPPVASEGSQFAMEGGLR
ncbi:MAG TPA: penicillin-binding protein 2, partial [Opitutaceae bacterium]|nr:penicillin-binding protein 2 [Opitutaceae bacterium]